jgi:glucose/arabinose dehydrogenase
MARQPRDQGSPASSVIVTPIVCGGRPITSAGRRIVNSPLRSSTAVLCLILGVVAMAQEPVAPRPDPAAPLTGAAVRTPIVSTTDNGIRLRVVPVATGLSHPTGLVFLPDGRTMLLTERPGRLRIVRDGVLDPKEVAGLPKMNNVSLGGLNDVVLHPDFAANRTIYLSYSKDGERGVTLAVARARLDGDRLTDLRDIFVADAWAGTVGTYGGRMVFGPDRRLYVAVGDRDDKVSTDDASIRMQAQNLANHIGKVLRLGDDGSIPPDNPFVRDPKARGEIYTYGHRNAYGLAFHPETGALWESEFGPMGGDEINVLVAGHNYGWPLVSLGRNYTGTPVSDQPWWRPGMDMPVFHWNPVINPANTIFYTGRKFGRWTNTLIVAGAGSKVLQQLNLTRGVVTVGDSMLHEINVRFRDVRQGPDELLYVLTEGRSRGNDDTDGMLLRIEPA